MRPIIPLVLISASAIAAARASEKTPEGDLARLQGRWTTKAGPKRDVPVVLEVEGRNVQVEIVTPRGWTLSARGELQINEQATPRTLDWVKFTGPDGQVLPEVLAIYEWDGANLKICNAGPNNPRPTEFQAGDGVLANIFTFERPPAEARADTEGRPGTPDAIKR